jgi:virginiamycin B lyase
VKLLYRIPGVLVAIFLAGTGHAQTITEFAIPTSGSQPVGIVAGPDGALWFAEGNGSKIGRITTDGTVTEYPVPTSNSWPTGITAGPDGALWFTERIQFNIGRITTAGAVTEYPVPTPASLPTQIVLGSDGALWFIEVFADKIGRITTAGVVTEFAVPTANSQPTGITPGPDGALWFTERIGNKIGRITTDGSIIEFPLPVTNNVGRSPGAIVNGPDGALWFGEADGQTFAFVARMTTAGALTEYPVTPQFTSISQLTVGPDGAIWFTKSSGLARITTSGVITEYPLPDPQSGPNGISTGPDGAMWFTELFKAGKIGRYGPLPTSGALVSAVLPLSRSVRVGATATAFATIINATANPALGCTVLPATQVPGRFFYQTTNPSTNALTGTPGAAASIAAGGSQSFVVAFTPNAPFGPESVGFSFNCASIGTAATVAGLNTLLLSASTTPTPDLIVEAATLQNDGIVHVTNGSPPIGVFAVATDNLGSGDTITVATNTGTATLPITVTVCQTNPSTGACMQTPSAAVTTTINSNATPTFGIFVSASGAVPFDPTNNRIFVTLTDSTNAIRGETSVAAATQ